MKRLGVLPLPLDGMLVFAGLAPALNLSMPWMERGTVRVKCRAQAHNTMSLARAQTQTAQSRDDCTNYETTVPPYMSYV